MKVLVAAIALSALVVAEGAAVTVMEDARGGKYQSALFLSEHHPIANYFEHSFASL